MTKTKERHPRQPLNYQSLGVSCWVTSVMNALLVLKKGKERIPVLANRLLFSVLFEEGVEDNEAKVIITAIRDLCSLAEEVIKSEKDIINRVTNIEDNEVIIADTGSGEHSILILGRRKEDNWLKVFDPDWENVKDKKQTENYICLPDIPDISVWERGRVNAMVAPSAFFDKNASKNNRFAFGSKKEWTIIVLKNNR